MKTLSSPACLFLGLLVGSLHAEPTITTHVHAATPTPMFTGYLPDTRTCLHFINDDVPQPTGLELQIIMAHEEGHCHALRLGLQKIEEGTTRFGESFADVYAIASLPAEDLDAGVALLIELRKRDRRTHGAYNTILAVLRARSQLPTTLDALTFTVNFFEAPK